MPRHAAFPPLVGALVVAGLGLGPTSRPAVAADRVTTPAPGLRLLERTTTAPARRIFVASTSLCTAGVRVDARSSQDSRITAAAWGSAMGATLAVNGDFYRTDRTVPTVYGDAVGVGQRWPASRTGLGAAFADEWYAGDYGWIAFGDGWVEFNHSGHVKDHAAELGVALGYLGAQRTTTIPAGTRALVSGFPELVVEGAAMRAFPDRSDCAARHPRTAMGLTADRATFLLVAVDGRSTSSVGMTCAELAGLMHELGAHTAFNLDGGGSTQMWVDGRGTINQPSDGSARAVANHWGVFAGGAGPATSCFSAGGCFPAAVPAAIGARFGDLPDDDPAAEEAAVVVERGLMSTCQAEPAMFCPACGLTRADAITLVVRAAGLALDPAPTTTPFSDLPVDAPAFAEIAAAAAAGWTIGCGGGALCGGDVVARAELATLIARARGWAQLDGTTLPLDVGADHAAAAEIGAVTSHCASVAEATCAAGFCPDQPTTRAAAAQLVAAAFALTSGEVCQDPGAPPGPADPEATAPEAGGCASGGGRGGAAAFALVLLALAVRRRRGARAGVVAAAVVAAGCAGDVPGQGVDAGAGPGADAVEGDGSCPRARVMVAAGASLNVRAAPSTTAMMVGSLPDGAVVPVLGQVEGEVVGGEATWLEVEAGAVRGFVSGAYAACTTDPAPVLQPPDAFRLPLACGTSARIAQANGGSFSHSGRSFYAFDFSIPVDTPLVAMADGVVSALFADTGPGDPCYDGGPSSCFPYANYVELDHGDGTASIYKHLNRVDVALGQFVPSGVAVGLSGSTGYSTGPHAHVMRQEACGEALSCMSVGLAFADVPGDGVPVQGQTVTSANCPR
ncbi:MAG: phosphodiester glycosidase family protein [Kofleriaceae bacterium]|nr:phosphodiester glycosidase family protein [Kofleriaceae bacterium]